MQRIHHSPCMTSCTHIAHRCCTAEELHAAEDTYLINERTVRLKKTACHSCTMLLLLTVHLHEQQYSSNRGVPVAARGSTEAKSLAPTSDLPSAAVTSTSCAAATGWLTNHVKLTRARAVCRSAVTAPTLTHSWHTCSKAGCHELRQNMLPTLNDPQVT